MPEFPLVLRCNALPRPLRMAPKISPHNPKILLAFHRKPQDTLNMPAILRPNSIAWPDTALTF